MNNRFGIAFKIFRKSFRKIVAFEVLYKLITTAVFSPLIAQMVRLALNLSGINYLTNARVLDFLKKPTTIAVFFLMLVILGFFSLMEISTITWCLDMTYHKKHVTVVDMVKEGSKSALRLLGRHNFMMLFFVIIVMPVTHLLSFINYISSVQIVEFIIEFLKTQEGLITSILVLYAALAVFAVRWVNVIGYYCVEKKNFNEARKASIRLNQDHYAGLIVSFVSWQILFFGIFVVQYMLATFVVTRLLMFFLSNKVAYAGSLLVGKGLYAVTTVIYSSMVTPISLAILMGYYYAGKKKKKEPIEAPVIEEKESEEVGNKRSKLRRVLKGSVVLAACLNILYLSYDIGITGLYNVQLFRKTTIAAHRGYSAEAPENTIPAFEAAIFNDSDYVELDVQETRDGEIIVMHDSNFKRVAGVKKYVWDVDYEEVQTYDVGKWYSEEFVGTRIPTLREVMEMAQGNLKLNIEIKLTGQEQHLEESVVRLIEEFGMEKECVVTSFQSKALRNVKKLNKDIKTGYILKVAFGDFSRVRFADALSVNYSFASASFINRAHNSGKKVYVWTVNDSETMYEMLKRGADMIITDDPVMAKETLTSYETTPVVVKLIKWYMRKSA